MIHVILLYKNKLKRNNKNFKMFIINTQNKEQKVYTNEDELLCTLSHEQMVFIKSSSGMIKIDNKLFGAITDVLLVIIKNNGIEICYRPLTPVEMNEYFNSMKLNISNWTYNSVYQLHYSPEFASLMTSHPDLLNKFWSLIMPRKLIKTF